jgi:hypothetical protein
MYLYVSEANNIPGKEVLFELVGMDYGPSTV